MNVMHHSGPMELVTIGVQPGEKLLESVRKACREKDIRNGAVVSGVGTFRTCHMHYIADTGFPPRDVFFRMDKPLELLSVNGLIADGQPHLHIVVSCGENEVYGGHLEEDSEVAYLAEVAILKCNELRMTRRRDEQRQISLLGPDVEGD